MRICKEFFLVEWSYSIDSSCIILVSDIGPAGVRQLACADGFINSHHL